MQQARAEWATARARHGMAGLNPGALGGCATARQACRTAYSAAQRSAAQHTTALKTHPCRSPTWPTAAQYSARDCTTQRSHGVDLVVVARHVQPAWQPQRSTTQHSMMAGSKRTHGVDLVVVPRQHVHVQPQLQRRHAARHPPRDLRSAAAGRAFARGSARGQAAHPHGGLALAAAGPAGCLGRRRARPATQHQVRGGSPARRPPREATRAPLQQPASDPAATLRGLAALPTLGGIWPARHDAFMRRSMRGSRYACSFLRRRTAEAGGQVGLALGPGQRPIAASPSMQSPHGLVGLRLRQLAALWPCPHPPQHAQQRTTHHERRPAHRM